MAEILDQSMIDAVDDESHLLLTEEEDRVLALYDKLQELRLEIAIINAQRALQAAPVGQERRPNDAKHTLMIWQTIECLQKQRRERLNQACLRREPSMYYETMLSKLL